MELGRMPEIDNAKANHVQKLEKVKETDNDSKIVPDEKYKNASVKEDTAEVNEVILDNIQFGYNKKSQDFYIKVTRGDSEYRFPTEDMMKMKAFLLETMHENSK
jgi:uncharacterized FlaG/YvyC family protein